MITKRKASTLDREINLYSSWEENGDQRSTIRSINVQRLNKLIIMNIKRVLACKHNPDSPGTSWWTQMVSTDSGRMSSTTAHSCSVRFLKDKISTGHSENHWSSAAESRDMGTGSFLIALQEEQRTRTKEKLIWNNLAVITAISNMLHFKQQTSRMGTLNGFHHGGGRLAAFWCVCLEG